MSKITAVEWLFSQMPFEWTITRSAFDFLQQAKEMENEQLQDAFKSGATFGGWMVKDAVNPDAIDFETYHKQTYQNDN
jgi:hypothetical protein